MSALRFSPVLRNDKVIEVFISCISIWDETNSILKLPMCKKKEKYSSRGSTIKKQTTIVAEW